MGGDRTFPINVLNINTVDLAETARTFIYLIQFCQIDITNLLQGVIIAKLIYIHTYMIKIYQ